MRLRELLFSVKLALLAGVATGLLAPRAAQAHVSEQGFVLLLPTEAYRAAGLAVVVLTILAAILLPHGFAKALFGWRAVPPRSAPRAQVFSSLASTLAFFFLIYLGMNGPRDPLSNLLPLSFWTVGWIGVVSLAGVFGDLWRWINPWTGIYTLLGAMPPLARLPASFGSWPSVLLLGCFAAFLLADPAPADPARLATVLSAYWLAMMAGLVVFGRDWLERVELGHAVFRAYGALAPLRLAEPAGLGFPGWQFTQTKAAQASGVFALTLLAVGSFDGLNETFWWLAQIDVNPLEFPGRSAIIAETISGVLLAVVGLVAVFAFAVWAGLALARSKAPFSQTFNQLAQSLLPIALAYHIAHYLPSFLVTIQYTLAALNDPFAQGADWLGIEPFYVTTGFFNQIDSVRVIWLTQACVVVAGHVWSVLLGHRLAQMLAAGRARVVAATLPLSGLMIAYTFLGLWLLATARGA